MKLMLRHKGNIETVDIGSGFWVRSEGRNIPTLCADSRDGKSQFDLEMNVALCERTIEQLQKLKLRLSIEADSLRKDKLPHWATDPDKY